MRTERAVVEPDGRVALDAVVTHHTDGFRSGVARFNELLADALGVPLAGLDELDGRWRRPLLSFKVGELDQASAATVERWLAGAGGYELFLHDFLGSELERALVLGAQRVLCGNAEVEAEVRPLNPRTETLWTPGLLVDDRVYHESELSVFSFGMAHKLRLDMFARLRSLLDDTGRTYAVYVSAANHETASLRDSESVFRELHEIFPDELYFLGNLSDVAVFNELRAATYYAAFFPGGVRANNTSVASALERGAVVLTNLDEYSPPEYRHGDNLLDIERCDRLPTDAETLRRISAAALDTARDRSWARLVERLR
jgi:hypothetical protein